MSTVLDPAVWTGKILLDEWVPGGGGERAVLSPSTGAELGRVGWGVPADVDRAAAVAVQAQRAWAATPYDQRAAVLRKAGDLLQQLTPDIAAWLAGEAGSAPFKAGFEAHVAAEECFEAAALASAPSGEVLRTATERLSFSRRVPVGVVGVISPFNVPLILSIRAVAPALALGNAVILKPDPRTAVSAGVVLGRVFAEAGLPAGVLTVVNGAADVGEALVAHRDVRVIAFTGSTRGGRAVAATAAAGLKRTHLELGGNSALIVLDDVDVEAATSVGAFGSYFHSGQICMATSRHLVHSAIAEEYVERLAARAEKLTVGDPLAGPVDLGPLIDAGQRDRVHDIVTRTVAAGARVVAGGTYDGLFYRPTVLADVPVDSPASTEEIFGPVAPVITFDSIDEAVEMARSTEYGLALGVLTRDVMRGLEIADRIPSGLIHINDQTVNDESTAPFGGVGDSGTGSRHGGAQANLEAFTEVQWTTMRRDLPVYPF